jgi:polysaccharide biosynthesis protein PslA
MTSLDADIIPATYAAQSPLATEKRPRAALDFEFRQSTASGLPLLWAGERPADPALESVPVWQWSTKRLVDIALSTGALFLLFPLLTIVALAIVLTDRGPVFFRQKRVGKDGKLFDILKFRSMRVQECDASGVAQTVAGDDRVTRIGAFIRRTSIDELPQLFNILLGQMSIVGPRPHVPGMQAAGKDYDALVPYYGYRHLVAPGLTGWAQANGFRGETKLASAAVQRIEHDVAYIQNYSLFLDFQIMLRTARREFLSGSGV